MIGEPVDELYREVILDHHRHPRGDRPLDHPDVEASGRNPACGDEVTLHFGTSTTTLVDLTLAMARTPGSRPSSSAASLLISDTTR